MFLNPIMLAGLGGAAIPLVLHLLSRARYRSVDWGAMMFLTSRKARQLQSTRLRQLILLLVRMAIVALLAMALARPVLSRGSALAEEARGSVVILLDRSMSTAFEENGRPRFEACRQSALAVLGTLKRGDQVALVELGARTDVPVQFTTDLQSLASRIDGMQPDAGKADVADGLARASKLLQNSPAQSRELYIITDRQNLTWEAVSEQVMSQWRQDFSVDDAPRVGVVLVGSEDRDNVVVESVAVLGPSAARGTSADLEVRVRNHGALPRNGLPLTLSAAGRQLPGTTVNLAPDSTASVNVTVKLDTPGPQVLSAGVTSTGLRADDMYSIAIEVTDPVRVLLVGPTKASGLDYVSLALMPFKTSGTSGTDPTEIRRVQMGEVTAELLAGVDVVIVSDPVEAPVLQARLLEQFVYQGGGLLVAPGDQTRIESLNRQLWKDGVGLLPARLKSVAPADGSRATTVLGLELTHPSLLFLRGRADPMPGATVGRFTPVVSMANDARVLASYASSEPMLIERPFGRGTVMLLTTTLSADWNTLPNTSFYLPFLQSTVRHLSGTGNTRRNLQPGETFELAIDGPVERNTAAVIHRGVTRQAPLPASGDRLVLRFTDTQQPGEYQVRIRRPGGGVDTDCFVVRPPLDESDLQPVSASRIAELSTRMPFEVLPSDKDKLMAVVERRRAGRELFLAGILAVVLLAIVEMGLSRWWSSSL